jgi:hypothetical protein
MDTLWACPCRFCGVGFPGYWRFSQAPLIVDVSPIGLAKKIQEELRKARSSQNVVYQPGPVVMTQIRTKQGQNMSVF